LERERVWVGERRGGGVCGVWWGEAEEARVDGLPLPIFFTHSLKRKTPHSFLLPKVRPGPGALNPPRGMRRVTTHPLGGWGAGWKATGMSV